MADTEEMCEARIRHRTRVASHPRGDSREEAMSESDKSVVTFTTQIMELDASHEDMFLRISLDTTGPEIGRSLGPLLYEDVEVTVRSVAKAAEESAAKVERSKRAAELIAKMRRVANSAVFGIPSEALAGIHADLDELRELLEVGDG